MQPVKHWVTCGFQQRHQNYHQVVFWNLRWNKLSWCSQVKIYKLQCVCTLRAKLYWPSLQHENAYNSENCFPCLAFFGWHNINKIVCFCCRQSRQAKASVHGKSTRKQLVFQVFIHILPNSINNINITWMKV